MKKDTGLHKGSIRKESAGFGLRDVYKEKDYSVVHSKVKREIKKQKAIKKALDNHKK